MYGFLVIDRVLIGNKEKWKKLSSLLNAPRAEMLDCLQNSVRQASVLG